MKKYITGLKNIINGKTLMVKALILSQDGESFVDTGIKILIAVVIGALVLAGLYTLFGNTILPTLTERIQEMFNYGG